MSFESRRHLSVCEVCGEISDTVDLTVCVSCYREGGIALYWECDECRSEHNRGRGPGPAAP